MKEARAVLLAEDAPRKEERMTAPLGPRELTHLWDEHLKGEFETKKASTAKFKVRFTLKTSTGTEEYAIAAERASIRPDGTVVFENAWVCWEPLERKGGGFAVWCTAQETTLTLQGKLKHLKDLKNVPVTSIHMKDATVGG